jgi:hypothetical protein
MSKKKNSKKIKKLDAGYYHEALDRAYEALDRAYIVANIIEDVLVEHPVFMKHKKLRKGIKKAQRLILKAYQLVGGLEYKLFPDKGNNK